MDRRKRRTQRLLGDALISLILEKGYEAITIKDITDRADVAYITFFRNYQSIDDLLTQRLDTVVEEIIAHLESTNNFAEDAVEEGAFIFQHVQDHQALYRILLGSPGAVHVVKNLRQTIARKVRKDCETLVDENRCVVPLDLISYHVAAALLAMVEWWLDHDMPYPPRQMGQMYEALIINSTWQVLAPGQSHPQL